MPNMQMFKKSDANKADWSSTGSFMNKPNRGWLHPDDHLARTSGGVCYGVRVGIFSMFSVIYFVKT